MHYAAFLLVAVAVALAITVWCCLRHSARFNAPDGSFRLHVWDQPTMTPDDLAEIRMMIPEERDQFNDHIDREFYIVHGGG